MASSNLSGDTPQDMGSDAQFTASSGEDNLSILNPTFIQNQISIQRSPSTAKSHATALGRTLSTRSTATPDLGRKHSSTPRGSPGGLLRNLSVRSTESVNSNNSYDADLSNSAILSVLVNNDGGLLPAHNNESTQNEQDSSSPSCTLTKSSSISTVRSGRSVNSAVACGTIPIGQLRIHSPSPERPSTAESFEGLKDGDIVMMAGITAGCIVAYDNKHFMIRDEDSFEGLKEVPPGAHFIWGGSSKSSLRTGVWLLSASLESGQLGKSHILRWDQYEECVIDEVSAAETRNQRSDIPKLYEKFRKYDSDNVTINTVSSMANVEPPAGINGSLWPRLTSCVGPRILSKITGKVWNHWQVSSVHDYKASNPMSIGEMHTNNQVLSFIFPKDTRTYSTKKFGRERTEQAVDTSAHILAVIQGSCTDEDFTEIIGEFQFCYITGMSLGNAACLEHWVHMILIIFRGFQLVLSEPVFICKFIHAVHAQMIYDEVFDGSIFDSETTLEKDLKIALTTFKSRLDEVLLSRGNKLTSEQEAVGKAFEELESWLWKWNWDLRGNYVRSGKLQLEDGEVIDAELKDFEAEDERGEYAPQIVELDEDGRQIDMIIL